jgi:hypothetical protein
LVEALDLARLQRDELGLGAGLPQGLARLLELDLLEHVGRENRDLLPLELVAHGSPFRLFFSFATGLPRDRQW